MGRNLGPRSVSVGSECAVGIAREPFQGSMTNVSGCDARDRLVQRPRNSLEKLDGAEKERHPPLSRDRAERGSFVPDGFLSFLRRDAAALY